MLCAERLICPQNTSQSNSKHHCYSAQVKFVALIIITTQNIGWIAMKGSEFKPFNDNQTFLRMRCWLNFKFTPRLGRTQFIERIPGHFFRRIVVWSERNYWKYSEILASHPGIRRFSKKNDGFHQKKNAPKKSINYSITYFITLLAISKHRY